MDLAARGVEMTTPRAREVTEVHTQLLRLALGVEESRAFWSSVEVGVSTTTNVAFEQRWFRAKSPLRVRNLLAYLETRYGAYPEALSVLQRWRDMTTVDRQVICHWHLQLADPLYRKFSGHFLAERRELRDSKLDRDVVVRWVKREYPERWAEATCVQFASKLLSAASEAGLMTSRRDPRELLLPRVSDDALSYWLYFLRTLGFAGTMLDNPYFASVGLPSSLLQHRLRSLPSVEFRRMADVVEFDWRYSSLTAWAEASQKAALP